MQQAGDGDFMTSVLSLVARFPPFDYVDYRS
jgi:hypothetical protein